MYFLTKYRSLIHQLYMNLQKANEAKARNDYTTYNTYLRKAKYIQQEVDVLEYDYYKCKSVLFDPNYRRN